MIKRILATAGSLALIGGLSVGLAGPASASNMPVTTTVVCTTEGSVALYTNSAMTTLVDSFSFTAPGKVVTVTSKSGTLTDTSLRVAVTGNTGTPYIFQWTMTDATNSHVNVSDTDWLVTRPNRSVVADANNGTLVISANGTEIISKAFGPTEHGLFLSGGLGFSCPGM